MSEEKNYNQIMTKNEMSIDEAEIIIDDMYQDKYKILSQKTDIGVTIDLSKLDEIAFTNLEFASVRALREIQSLRNKIKELKEKNKELEKYDYRKIKIDEKDKISSIHFTKEQLELMNLGIALYVGIPKLLADAEDEKSDI